MVDAKAGLIAKGTLLGTPNREPQEYSRYMIGICLPESLYSIIFLLHSWGSLFGVPSRVPLIALQLTRITGLLLIRIMNKVVLITVVMIVIPVTRVTIGTVVNITAII